MALRLGTTWLTLLFLLAASGTARAQCTKDIDCKGDRICEAGRCIAAPVAAPAPAPTSTEGAPPAAVPAAAPAAPPPAPAPAAAPAGTVAPAPAAPPVAPEEPKTKRNSTGLMAGGITLISIAPVALLVAAIAAGQKSSCRRAEQLYFNPESGEIEPLLEDCDRYDPTIYGFTIGGIALFGAGIPMFIIGSRRVPVEDGPSASVKPWVSPDGAGATFRLEL